MDGIHDLGGRQGFGPVNAEVNEPVFHDRWEAKVFTMVNAAMGAGAVKSVDQFRHAVERIDPIAYLTHGYYGRWLGGVETLLIEAGIVTGEEISARAGSSDQIAARPVAKPDKIDYPRQPSAQREVKTAPRFSKGQAIVCRSTPSSGHTRLPAYVRGKAGIIEHHRGGWVLPDSNAHGLGESPEHLYTVRFAAQTLWGDEAEPGTSVCIDLFESYLQKAL
ncbi:MAG: nitrile hydratase subunit beta [Proteobacteria bacterium]|nr:nitrile hydratase subunit beta [Pseudomonadota bacterium]